MISFMINTEKWSEANLPVRRIYIFGRIWTPFVREKGPIGFQWGEQMIKIENVEVMGWGAAIRGMRNPMNSWDRSDSGTCSKLHWNVDCDCEDPENCSCLECDDFIIGPKDKELMMKLRNAGTDHRKFMRMITVYVDITAPLYWWKEFDTYKVGTVANSCSTMHKIHEKEFTLDDFSHEHLLGVINYYDGLEIPLTSCYIKPSIEYSPMGILESWIIPMLNKCREMYLETKSSSYLERGKTLMVDVKELQEKQKLYWWQMIQLLPSSYNQKRTVMLNYEVLANIYKSRKNHKLDEWRDFCKWIENLPYSELITGASLEDVPICNQIMEEAKRRVENEEDKK